MTVAQRRTILLLVVIMVSYFVVGFPDGAFTVSWLGIAADIAGMTTAHTGWILVAYSITYTIAGIILEQLSRRIKLQTIYLIGLVIMALGFVGLALALNFTLVMTGITIYGFGTGLMASSMNSYMAKHFTAGHNNLMHCFWGGGAMISPIIMGQIMNVHSWRMGYYVIVGILIVVAVILLLSRYAKLWIDDSETTQAETVKSKTKKRYLTKRWHQVVEVCTFFFLGGTDYTLVFFTGAALIARGEQTIETIAWFSVVYYAGMVAGRLVFGFAARWLKEVPIIRAGAAIAVIGLAWIYFTSSLPGMALIGFGLGPLLPTLVSDTSNRFTPRVVSKIVGLELAAFGAGIAVLFFLTSQIMHFVSYEALFGLALAFIVLVFICNEILNRAVALCNSKK